MIDRTPRRANLDELADETAEVYDPAAIAALRGGACSRYGLLTAEDAYPHNPNLTLHDSIDELEKAATAEANEYPAWDPVKVVDLDTGRQLVAEVITRVEVSR